MPVLPSTAFDAGKEAFSVDDAVAGMPWESNVAAFARLAGLATSAKAARQRHHHSNDRDPPAGKRPAHMHHTRNH